MLSFLAAAVNIAIIWTNTTVLVPLNDSLEPYKAIPEAHLYINDELVIDPEMFIEREVSHTTFRVIRTHIVGTYRVAYKVTFPKYGLSSTEYINFVIEDLEKPNVDVGDIIINVGNKDTEYEDYVQYDDNYDEHEDLKLHIDDSQVNTSEVGKYNIHFSVYDQAMNYETITRQVNVIDTVKPIIKQLSPIKFEIGENVDYAGYFKITDNYDHVLKTLYDDSEIDYDKTGNYTLSITSRDQSGNRTSVKTIVEIVDETTPTIKVQSDEITLNYMDEVTTQRLLENVIDVSDNYDNLTKEDISIISYVNTKKLGKYEVIYKLKDSSKNETELSIYVNVMDLTKPTFEFTKEQVVKVNDLEPYLKDYINLIDNHDQEDDLTLTQSTHVDTTKTGQYRVNFEIMDKSKNVGSYTAIFEVVDDIEPTIKQLDKIVINDFLVPNYATYFEITDNYDEDLDIVYIDSEVDYDTIGIYQLGILVTDASGNYTTFITEIHIQDIESPEIVLTSKEIFVSYDELIELETYIDVVYDNYQKDISKSSVVITSNHVEGQLGRYEVIYELEDNSLNKTTESLTLIIGDYMAPIIIVDPIVINKHDVVNFKSFAKAFDDYDRDISENIQVNPTYIPIETPGYYEAVFYVHDSSGNYAEQKVIITVLDKVEITDYVIYVAGGVLIIGLFGLYYFLSKRKVKF